MSSRTDARVGLGQLPAHLHESYGVTITHVHELDLGVFAVEHAESPSWIVRVFPAERAVEQAQGDAEILELLAALDYPAERAVTAAPVSTLQGQAVLVSELVPSVPRSERRSTIGQAGGLAALGERLGRLHSLEHSTAGSAAGRPGGAWHHLADGAPAAEIAALTTLLEQAAGRVPDGQRSLYDSLCERVGALDSGEGLPLSLTHPDFVLANVIASPSGALVIVDWAGAGQAARMWSLAFLLWSVGFGGDLARVDRVVAGYRSRVLPEAQELDRLRALVAVRPIVFDAWAFATGRKTLAEAAGGLASTLSKARAIARRAREAFGAT